MTPASTVRRWMMEIRLADKAEKEWRADAQKVIEIYEGNKVAATSFNILWSNTETLRPAIYNSLPKPDVRKRWDDVEDDVGDAAAQMLERAISYSLDNYCADAAFKLTALDVILPGRGIDRVRYVPAFAPAADYAEAESAEPPEQEQMEGTTEELAYEQCVIEHVSWDDFRHGPGKTWDEVTWIAFRHRLTRDQLDERFPEVAAKVPMDAPKDDDLQKLDDPVVQELFKTCDVWEIWNKDDNKVYFIAPSFKDQPLSILDDPLGLIGFFPVAEPVRAIEKSDSMVPTTLYALYKAQAEELNLISDRINKLTKVLKYRGAYDSTLGAVMADIAKGNDGQLIPADNVQALRDIGGLEKGIWLMPIEQLANILGVLENQRAACKQAIYEITGISDIVRGSSQASETATAQQIKAQFGTLRLQRIQRDIQRYCRDVIRIMAEVIAEKFQPETLMQISGMNLPTEQQVMAQMQQMQMQYQQAVMQAQQAGQQPPAPPQMDEPPVTIEQVMQVLRSDLMRQYRIDIETDSTISALESADQKAIGDLLQGLSGLAQALIPASQAGLIPVEAGREIISSVIRRFKLGRSVEDAIEQGAKTAVNPEIQQQQQQLQQANDELNQKAQAIEQEGQKLQMDKMRAEHENEMARLKIEHSQQIADMAQQKAHDDTLTAVNNLLMQHKQAIDDKIAGVMGMTQ